MNLKHQQILLRALPYLMVVALLPVMILRDFTPSNELRYLSIADEALRNGNLFTFTNQGVPYADKPPLYLWIVMCGKLLFGSHQMGFLALFSLLPALGILRIMERWTAARLSTAQHLSAAAMLMTSGLFLGLAVVLRMDMLMCFFITLSLYLFWRIYTGEGNTSHNRTWLPVCVFLALFTKGPVGLLVPLVSMVVFLAWKRRLGHFARFWGARACAILLGGCLVWFAAVWIEGGTEYLNNLLFHQTLDRAVDAFHHKEPIWYYAVTMWYSLAPWSLLVIGALIAALVRRMPLDDLEQFFLTVIGSTLVMLSAFSSKLAVYLAPTFPFFIYLGALLLARMRTNNWMRLALLIPALVWIGLLPALLLVWNRPEAALLHDARALTALGILCFTGLMALWLLRRRTLHASIGSLAAGLMAALFVGGLLLPKANPQLGYGPLCRAARETAERLGYGGGYYVWEMHRPEAMDVYLDEDVQEIATDEILAGRGAGGLLLLPAQKLTHDPQLQQYVATQNPVASGPYLIVPLGSRDSAPGGVPTANEPGSDDTALPL